MQRSPYTDRASATGPDAVAERLSHLEGWTFERLNRLEEQLTTFLALAVDACEVADVVIAAGTAQTLDAERKLRREGILSAVT